MTKKKAPLTADLLKESAELPVTEGAPQRGSDKRVKGPSYRKGGEFQSAKEETVPLNFRVPESFRKEWHLYARSSDRTGVHLLMDALAALKEKERNTNRSE